MKNNIKIGRSLDMFKKVSIFCLCMSLLMETGASVAFSAPNKKRAAGNRKNYP